MGWVGERNRQSGGLQDLLTGREGASLNPVFVSPARLVAGTAIAIQLQRVCGRSTGYCTSLREMVAG
jgi:hypothetical protein